MLTLILLVVLGGGVGLLAVWLIEPRGLSRLLGRFAPGSLRPARRTATSPPPTAATATAVNGSGPRPAVHERVRTASGSPTASAADARRTADRVPAAYTAVEGTYREVARAPLWRKVLSLVLIVAILVVIGVTIAAVAGATFGIVAELVDGAVG